MTDDTTLRGDFDQFDTDGNGTIDLKEFTALLDFLDVSFSGPEAIQAAFSAIDSDGSGQIEFPEFRTWWAKYQDA